MECERRNCRGPKETLEEGIDLESRWTNIHWINDKNSRIEITNSQALELGLAPHASSMLRLEDFRTYFGYLRWLD